MITQAIDRILALKEPTTVEVDGLEYTNRNLHPVMPPQPKSLQVRTLTAIISYLNDKIDQERPDWFVHVEAPNSVVVYEPLNHSTMTRNCYMVATCPPMQFPDDQWIKTEEFIPKIQAMFDEGGDKAALLKSAGSVVASATISVKDDGVTQETQGKTGIARQGDIELPSTVTLRPFCTFPEIEQPERKFVFRMKRERDEILCRLIPADGETWKPAAMSKIAEFLSANLPTTPVLW